MRTAAFLVSFFLLLISGSNPAMAGNGNSGKSFLTSQKSSALFQLLVTNDQRDSVTWGSLEDEQQEVLCEEVEDEDGSSDHSRKFKLLTSHFVIPSYGLVLNFHHNSAPPIPFIWRQVSYKYIQQRNLRI